MSVIKITPNSFRKYKGGKTDLQTRAESRGQLGGGKHNKTRHRYDTDVTWAHIGYIVKTHVQVFNKLCNNSSQSVTSPVNSVTTLPTVPESTPPERTGHLTDSYFLTRLVRKDT